MMKKIFEPQSSLHHSSLLVNLLLILALLLGLIPLQSARAAGGAWEMTGSMNIPRAYHTATLLLNGQVLVEGGMDLGNYLASAELYNPTTGRWTLTGSLVAARSGHTAALLKDGRVLVAGGANVSGVLDSAELYDPATGTWNNAGSLALARVGHTATLLSNGKVLVAGGRSTNGTTLASAELFDPGTGKWSSTGTLVTARSQHTATLLPNGKVLVAGGWNYDLGDLTRAELYDPATGKWSVTSSMTVLHDGQTATLLYSAEVLVAGYKYIPSSDLYHPDTRTWTSTGSMHDLRAHQTATLLPNGMVLAVGGDHGSGSGYYCLWRTELYDSASGIWSTTGSMSTGRIGHTATLLTNSRVLVAGGRNEVQYHLASAELYIGGRVKISGNAGMAGVKLSYFDLVPRMAISDARGYYSFTVPEKWSGSVTPSKTGVPSFRPAFRKYTNLMVEQSLQDYAPNQLIRFVSIAAQDGYIREASENSGMGQGLNSAAVVFVVGDDSLNRQYRAILSFNTNSLPDNAVILSATLKLKKQFTAGIDPITTHGWLVMDIRKPNFGALPALQVDDFGAAAGLNSAGWVGKAPISGVYTGVFGAAAFPHINRTGLTQLRLRFQLDDDNDRIADWLAFFSSDVTVAAYRPVLEVLYYLP
jgi:hypothetical protein